MREVQVINIFACMRVKYLLRMDIVTFRQTTSGITERGRSPKPTWEGPEKLSCKCDLPPTWLPLGCQQQVHPREEKSEVGATFPANGMQNPGRRECPGKTWSSVPLGDESLPGSKGFPISLNGALIVIPRTRVESEMERSLKCDNFVGRQFSIGKRRTDGRRSCFQYLLSILPSFTHALFNSEVCARQSYGNTGEGTPWNPACRSSMKLKMFVSGSLREQEELELTCVNLSLMYASFSWLYNASAFSL